MNLEGYKGYDYESQEDDGELILSELPLSMIKDSIREQFENPTEYGKNDFVQTFETRWVVTKNNMDEENEEEITELYDQFISFMRDIFKNKLSLGFPYLEDMSENEQLQLIHYTYRFFIINLKDNYTRFIYNYINKHKDALADALPKKKDVATNTFKNTVHDDSYITIMASIKDTINLILHDDTITVDDFMELSRGDDANLENDFVNEKYDDFNINGNFVELYPTLMDDVTKTEIECKIITMILQKCHDENASEEDISTED